MPHPGREGGARPGEGGRLMEWLSTGSCGMSADLGWMVGALCGSAIGIAVIVAIAHAPRLREHGGSAPPPLAASGRALPWVPAALVAAIWLAGLCRAGAGLLFCYAAYSALAAAAPVIVLMAVLFPLAAAGIARRSIW
jgi:hypothetical protein